MNKKSKWGEVVLKRPIAFILLGLVLSFGLGVGGKNLKMSSDYRYFFGKDNPQRVAFEALQDIYSKDDSVLFLITPKSGNVFNNETLKAIRNLTDKSWKLPFSTRVDSITNFQYSHAEGDDLIVEDLVTEEALEKSLSKEELDKIRKIALNEPLLSKRLINDKSDVTAINVRMNFPGKTPFEIPDAAAAARKLSREFLEEFPNHEIRLSGIVMLNNAFNEAGMKDMMTLTPLMYLVIMIIMFIMIRTISGVIATFFVLFLSIIGGMGFAGWAGIPITPPSSIAPVVIMTLAIADSIHILKSILAVYHKGISKKDAIIEGIRVNLRPVFLTSFTTAIGFLALNFSDTPPFHDLGNITAVGVLVAFVLSVTFLPALIYLLPLKAKKENISSAKWPIKFSEFVTKRAGIISIVTVIITVFLTIQIPKIKLNDQFVEYFDDSIEFRNHAEYGMEKLAGIYQINYNLNSGKSQGITDPEYLKVMEDFSNYLRTVPGVVHVNSLTDTMKRLNKNMHGDNESFYKIPKQRELAAQYLLLYEMSLPYGLDLNNQIDIDKSSSRVIATLGNIETSQMLEITAMAEKWLKNNAPPQMRTLGTSPSIMFSHVSQRNVVAMGWATIWAFLLITIVMIVSLKSIKYGLISILPNAIPAALGFGIWSLTVGEAGFAIAVVGSVTLGIVVDDTVHFLTKYSMAKQEQNLTTKEAISYAFENVGSALITTSVILVIGFSVLMMSSFKLNFTLGALSALTIALALIVDFTFLPAVLKLADKKK